VNRLSVLSVLLDLLFPKKCVGCGQDRGYFCEGCVSSILQTDLICPQCTNLSIGGLTHPSCEREFSLDGLWSLGIYQGPLKKAIQKLKYEPSLVRDFGGVLVDILIKYWAKYQPFIFDKIKQEKEWVIIPVPLYWYRENKRGFNQSKLLGQLLSKKLGLDYCDGLKRIRYTSSQVGLKRGDRKNNVSDAFAVTANYTLSPKPYTLLIDDVWTTGSTLRECCKVLKKAGAKKIWALTLAR